MIHTAIMMDKNICNILVLATALISFIPSTPIMSLTTNNMDSFTIVSFNCKNVKTSVPEIIDLCKSSDIIMLQETWLAKDEFPFLDSIHADFLSFGTSAMNLEESVRTGRPHGGMGIMWKRNLDKAIERLEYDSRIQGVKLSSQGWSILFLNVYMPTAKRENAEEIQDCLARIQVIANKSDATHKVLIGDWNSKPGAVEFDWLKQIAADSSFSIVDFEKLPAGTYTFVSDAHGSVSWLDHALFSDGFKAACSDVHVHHEFLTSDHKPLALTLELGSIPRVTEAEIDPYVVKAVCWDKVTQEQRSVFHQTTGEVLSALEIPYDDFICHDSCSERCEHVQAAEQHYEKVMDVLRSASEPLTSVKQSSTFVAVAGWNELVADAHKTARESLYLWRIHGKPRDGGIIHQRKCFHVAQFKYAFRACRNHADRMKADNMAKSHLNHDFKKFWSEVQRMNSKPAVATSIDGVSGNQDITGMWEYHYENILNSVHNPNDSEALAEAVNQADVSSVKDTFCLTRDCINEARASLKSRKSMGADGIAPEHFKYAHDIIDIHLEAVFNAMLRQSYLPQSFMPVTIVPIVKSISGDISSTNNYRPIAIATSASKLLELCLLDCLEPLLVTSDNQFGFKAGCSTDQCIFMLKEHIRKYVNAGGPVFACFLDASKAFDRVCHSTLFMKMLERGIPVSVVKLLMYWYSHQTMTVNWNGHFSKQFTVTNGVRQGGILSPALFSIYMDVLSSALNEVFTGCCLGEVSTNNMLYADDIVLISPSSSGLQDLLDVCTRVGEHLFGDQI